MEGKGEGKGDVRTWVRSDYGEGWCGGRGGVGEGASAG